MIEFDKSQVLQIEKDFKKVPVDANTLARIDKMGNFFKQYFPTLSIMALKGSISLAIKDWQQKSRMTVDQLEKMSGIGLKSTLQDINHHVTVRIKKIARNEDADKIDSIMAEAIGKAAEMY